MNEVTLFYEEQPIRVINRGGEQWFVAKDVADILGYSETSAMTRRLDEDEVDKVKSADLAGLNRYGNNDIIIINEFGLYSSILGSQVPKAKDFKRWITHDVLPSIRKTGSYTAAKPEPKNLTLDDELKGYIRDLLSASTNFARQCSRLSERNSYLEQFAPKADYGEENVLGQPRFQKRRGYYVANRGADVCKRDPEKYGYQQDLFYDRLPQILTETFNQAVKRLCIEE